MIEAKTMSLEEVKAFLTDKEKYVMEDGAIPYQTVQDVAFIRFVAENWEQALTLLSNDMSDSRGQGLIIVAAEYLPPWDYVRFLNGACDLMEAGKLKVEGCFFCLRDRGKNGFLEYNYDVPEVAAVINRIETIYKAQEPGQWDGYFSEIKSGERKKFVIEYFTREGWPMPETYKANSNEPYRWLVKIHEGLLTGKTMNETGEEVKKEILANKKKQVTSTTHEFYNNTKNQPAVEKKVPSRVVAKDTQLQNEPAPTKTTPWQLPLLIGIIATVGSIFRWRYFKKKGK